MCPAKTRTVKYTGEQCQVCLSRNHSTDGHTKLERAYRRWGLGLRTLAEQTELDLAGEPGAPLPSTSVSDQPDLLRIAPCSISVAGSMSYQEASPAVLRAWKRDPEDGCTFMLSLVPSIALSRILAVLSGDAGSIGSVELRLNRTTPHEELLTT